MTNGLYGELSSGRYHTFNESLKKNEQAKDEAFWLATYKKAFPGLACCMRNDNNNTAQRMGIDRVLLLNNGKRLVVDEKARYEAWPDILLEHISVDRPVEKKGWIEKDLPLDYLAYGVLPERVCFLFPWDALRKAWLKNKDNWKMKYKLVPAKNVNSRKELLYITYSIPVPRGVLLEAVRRTMEVHV